MKKLRTLELARVGRWGQNSDEISEKDLADVVATFRGTRPVGIGHDAMRRDDAPKWGDVKAVHLIDGGKALAGDVEFSAELDTLYESGRYNGWSVSIPRRAVDGRAYLHHLAFLGATPPKIPFLKDLGEKAFGYADGDEVIAHEFSGAIKNIENQTGGLMSKEEMEAMEAMRKENAELKEIVAKLQEELKKLEAEKKELTEKKGLEAGAKEVELPKEFSDKLKAYDEELRKNRLSTFKARVEGKVPSGVLESSMSLAGVLSERVKAVNFSDNGKERSASEVELLASILENWPQAVATGHSGNDYGDALGKGDKAVDWNAVAAKM